MTVLDSHKSIYLSSDAIEFLELLGQRQLVNAAKLPRQIRDLCEYKEISAAEIYAIFGIKVIRDSEADELFYDVKLPKGWKIKPTLHTMRSDLLDAKNKVKASIFYKAAFCDRSAFITIDTLTKKEKILLNKLQKKLKFQSAVQIGKSFVLDKKGLISEFGYIGYLKFKFHIALYKIITPKMKSANINN